MGANDEGRQQALEQLEIPIAEASGLGARGRDERHGCLRRRAG